MTCWAFMVAIWRTDPEIMVCAWLGELSYCSCLLFLPNPYWVLLSYVLRTFILGSVHNKKVEAFLQERREGRGNDRVGTAFTCLLHNACLRRTLAKTKNQLAIFNQRPITIYRRQFVLFPVCATISNQYKVSIRYRIWQKCHCNQLSL